MSSLQKNSKSGDAKGPGFPLNSEDRGETSDMGKRKIEDEDEDEDVCLRKRSRTDFSQGDASPTPGDPPVPEYKKHPRFWAMDGNVILQFQTIRFRVHQSRFSNESSWFDKLFNGRGDEDDNWPALDNIVIGESEGYPVYDLTSTGVDWEDFEALLAAMDDSIRYYYDPPPFPRVASILLVSHQLKFKHAFDFALNFVREMFPEELNDVENTSDPDQTKHAARTIILGRKCKIRSILKRAFYELACSSNLGVDEHGTEDGNDHIYQLSSADLLRIARGQKKLTARWLEILNYDFLNSDKEKEKACGKTCSSTTAKRQHWATLMKPGLLQKYQYDPIRGIQELIEIHWKKVGYCSDCASTGVRELEKVREGIWRDMDQWFALVEA